jgi:hypothetical protein
VIRQPEPPMIKVNKDENIFLIPLCGDTQRAFGGGKDGLKFIRLVKENTNGGVIFY